MKRQVCRLYNFHRLLTLTDVKRIVHCAAGSATTSTSALVGGSVALLLHGTVLSVPSSANHDTLVGKLSAGKVTQHAQPAASAG